MDIDVLEKIFLFHLHLYLVLKSLIFRYKALAAKTYIKPVSYSGSREIEGL